MAKDDYATMIDGAGRKWHMRTEPSRPKATYGRQFMVVFPESLMELARDRTASYSAMPIFTWLMSNAKFNDWTMLKQSEVAHEMGLSQSSVARALRDLLERDFIERRGSGPRQEWKLTPKGAWMGTAGAYQKECRERAADTTNVVPLHEEE